MSNDETFSTRCRSKFLLKNVCAGRKSVEAEAIHKKTATNSQKLSAHNGINLRTGFQTTDFSSQAENTLQCFSLSEHLGFLTSSDINAISFRIASFERKT